jgi:hypothetical protein
MPSMKGKFSIIGKDRKTKEEKKNEINEKPNK